MSPGIDLLKESILFFMKFLYSQSSINIKWQTELYNKDGSKFMAGENVATVNVASLTGGVTVAGIIV
jgi:hypothetical protein